MSEEDLEYFFEQIGEVRKVLITEEQDQEGFLQASVTYNTPEDAKMAYDLCNGFKILGLPMSVQPCRTGYGAPRSGGHYAGDYSSDGRLDLDGPDGEGIRMDNATRLALMARLSQRPVDVNRPIFEGKIHALPLISRLK